MTITPDSWSKDVQVVCHLILNLKIISCKSNLQKQMCASNLLSPPSPKFPTIPIIFSNPT